MRLVIALAVVSLLTACTMRGSPEDWADVAIGVGKIIYSH
jgi:hypothetical protein